MIAKIQKLAHVPPHYPYRASIYFIISLSKFILASQHLFYSGFQAALSAIISIAVKTNTLPYGALRNICQLQMIHILRFEISYNV